MGIWDLPKKMYYDCMLKIKREDIDKPDEDGLTLLFKAVCDGDNAMISYLLEHGANPDVEITKDSSYRKTKCDSDRKGCTPLKKAIQTSNVTAVKYLLENGADPNKESGSSGHLRMNLLYEVRSILFPPQNFMVFLGYDSTAESKIAIEIARLLIDHNLDINVRGFNDETPLFWFRSAPQMTRLLLSKGADPFAVNNSGQTSLDIIPGIHTSIASVYLNKKKRIDEVTNILKEYMFKNRKPAQDDKELEKRLEYDMSQGGYDSLHDSSACPRLGLKPVSTVGCKKSIRPQNVPDIQI